jgi:hypothetical protein
MKRVTASQTSPHKGIEKTFEVRYDFTQKDQRKLSERKKKMKRSRKERMSQRMETV